MDSQVANKFIEAVISIFGQVGNLNMKRCGLEYFPNGSNIKAGIATILGVTGALNGQFIIALDEPMALKIASAILMGIPVTSYDEVAESAVCEIGNMIGGEASQLLHKAGFICDITVPSIVRGEGMKISFYPASPLFIVKFESEWGPVQLILRFENKPQAKGQE